VNLAMALVLIFQVTLAVYGFVVPNFRDTTIRTRVTRGLQPPRITTLRLKGARERSDSELSPRSALFPRIWQCDRRVFITLLDSDKTYQSFPMPDLDEKAEARRDRMPARPLGPPGPVVTITTDSEDTGERRQMAGYEVKRIKTTVTVKPADGAGFAASKTEVDGWYVDLPDLACGLGERGVQPPVSGWLVSNGSGTHNEFKYIKTGNAVVGYAVEETSIVSSGGNVEINKTDLLEFSDQPIDESLFEIPPDYTAKPFPFIQRQLILRQFPLAKPNR
jgi:hypothetical protein